MDCGSVESLGLTDFVLNSPARIHHTGTKPKYDNFNARSPCWDSKATIGDEVSGMSPVH